VLDVAQELSRRLEVGREFAVATVVGVSVSAPREIRTVLAVDRDGNAIGSVSGGCVEGAAACVALGLTSGGITDVMVMPVTVDAPARTVGMSVACSTGQ
jgi:xanthine dehydrogenase accessory factor